MHPKSKNVSGCFVCAREAIALCKEDGYPITAMGLRHLAKNNPSIQFKVMIAPHYSKILYDIVELDECIKKARQLPPEGWVKLSDNYHLARNVSHFYSTVKKNGIETRIYGRNKHRYANEKTLRQIFEEC